MYWKMLELFVFFINTAKAELLKPNNKIDPKQVVKIQLIGLMKNNNPSKTYFSGNKKIAAQSNRH